MVKLMSFQDDFTTNLTGADGGSWYARADSFHGSQSPIWINPGHNQHQHHQHVYATEEDDSYVSQPLMNVGWKDVDRVGGQGGVIVGQLLHPHQNSVPLQPRSASRTSVYSTTSSSDRDSTSHSMESKQQRNKMTSQTMNPLILVRI